MKRILLFLLISSCLEGMLVTRTRNNFGTKHFIVGYDYSKKPVINNTASKKNKYISRPLVIQNSNINALELLDDKRPVQSFFTSRHDVRAIIDHILKNAKKSILIAAYNLTDASIARTLKVAHKKGIKVLVITDYSNMSKPHSKIKELVDAHVPVFYYDYVRDQSSNKKNERFLPLMHLKLIICDKEVAITGSSNLTQAGQKGNIETITVIRDEQSVREHIEEFKHLKPLCSVCQFFN